MLNIFSLIETFLASSVGKELTHDLITALMVEVHKLLTQHASDAIAVSQYRSNPTQPTGGNAAVQGMGTTAEALKNG